MGILGKIVGALKWAVSAPFIAIDYVLNTFADAGERMRSGVDVVLGLKKRKPPTEKIKAALRKQWLELAPGETEIPGVEWEGEIYYDTPK